MSKLKLYKRNRIQPFLGGQFHEYVFATQGEKALPKYYAESLALGFEAIEISDNVVPLSDAQRRQQIGNAVRAGLVVYGEVGSKETLSNPALLIGQAEALLRRGRRAGAGGSG
jgi:phosphosulfolactate synthase